MGQFGEHPQSTCALEYAFLQGLMTPDETEELRGLLERSLTLTSDGGILPPFLVPRSLEQLWWRQKFAETGFDPPGGIYRFNALCCADRERLVDLSQQYGWEPEADTICIAPLAEWDEDDLKEPFGLLWRATPRIERSMWVGRNDRLDLIGSE